MQLLGVLFIVYSMKLLTLTHANPNNNLLSNKPSRIGADLLKHDGILIERQGETRLIRGVWSVIIRIDPPRISDISAWMANMLDVIGSKTISFWGNGQVTYWRNRLSNLNTSLDIGMKTIRRARFAPPLRKTRKRRALIPFIGKMSHVLFGTATSSEVAGLKKLVRNAESSMKELFHN